MSAAAVDTTGISGIVDIEAVDTRTGDVVHRERVKNLFVTTGRNKLRDALAGSLASATDAQATHFAVGTGSTAVTAADTALGSETTRNSMTKTTTTAGQVVFNYFLSTSQANGSTLTEAGLFNAASSGTMLARVVHTGIAKTSSIAITYTWTITITAS